MAQSTASPSLETVAIEVHFFGKIADRFGRLTRVEAPADGCSLPALKARLADLVEGGALALSEPGLRAAIDQQIVDDDAWVGPGQDVALLSMFSGG